MQWVPIAGLSISFLLYFVVRGWTSAALVVMCLFCLGQLLSGRVVLSRKLFTPGILWLLAAFAAPLVAVIAVQLLCWEFVPRYFDGPSRLLMSCVILLYLIARPVNFVRIAEFVFPAAVLLCAAMLFLYPGASAYFWQGRFATYFMDPLTLAQHIAIAGFICLFCVDASARDPGWLRLLKYAGVAAAIAVSLGTYSRTGWTMVPILLAIWLIGVKRHNSLAQVSFVLIAIVLGCVATYWVSGIVQERVNTAVQEIVWYFSGGNRDTSLGVRLSLYRINWTLFLQSPIYGWGFRDMPMLSSTPEIAALATPMVEQYFVHSGGHNELMQSMMRMGVLGLVSRLMLVLVPLVVFTRAARASLQRTRMAGYLGLAVVIGFIAAGMTSEVFNLIYTASFYGLIVAALAPTALAEEARATGAAR
jgi:O-antigen ligase